MSFHSWAGLFLQVKRSDDRSRASCRMTLGEFLSEEHYNLFTLYKTPYLVFNCVLVLSDWTGILTQMFRYTVFDPFDFLTSIFICIRKGSLYYKMSVVNKITRSLFLRCKCVKCFVLTKAKHCPDYHLLC